MSDKFSGIDSSFVLPAMSPAVEALLPPTRPVPPARARSFDVPLAEIDFRRVRGADEFHAVHQLRAEIQLPGSAMADPGFRTREKKETTRG